VENKMVSASQLIGKMSSGYEKKCIELGIIKRKREFQSGSDLMLIWLFHLINGCSRREVRTAAKELHIGDFSDVAFMKKFGKCGEWFREINAELSECSVAGYQKPSYLEKNRVLGADASDILSNGSKTQKYRLHYAIDIFKMCCVKNKVTTQNIGETLKNFAFAKGDLVIADRIYGTVNGIAHCIKSGADFILRLRTNCFAFYDENHSRVDIIKAFTELKGEECADVFGFVKDADTKTFIPVRICAKRKSEDAIVQSREKLKRRAINKQHKLQPKTEIFNDYILVVTSLPCDISPTDILETYRYRWQIEMYFKRLKSILGIGDMPKKHETSSRAWIDGKIMVSLLIEAVLSEISFSPSAE
jgi:hypothetical protein